MGLGALGNVGRNKSDRGRKFLKHVVVFFKDASLITIR